MIGVRGRRITDLLVVLFGNDVDRPAYEHELPARDRKYIPLAIDRGMIARVGQAAVALVPTEAGRTVIAAYQTALRSRLAQARAAKLAATREARTRRRQDALAQHEAGLSYARIAVSLGVSRSRAGYIVKQAERDRDARR